MGRVLGTKHNVGGPVAVDADPRNGAVDLEPGLDVQYRAVGGEPRHHKSRRRGRLCNGLVDDFVVLTRMGRHRTTPFGQGRGREMAGEEGLVPLAVAAHDSGGEGEPGPSEDICNSLVTS